MIILFFAAIVSIMVAIFIFGEHGRHPDPNWEDVIRTVGVGIVAAMIASIIDRQFFVRHLGERISSDFREAAGVAKSLVGLGVYGAYPRFEFGRIFHEAKRRETVSWLDTYCPLQDSFLDELEQAVLRGVHVRMLVIDPEPENSKFRSTEMANTNETGEVYDVGLHRFILKMTSLGRKSSGNFELRFYRDLPCVPMYLVGKASSARKGYFSLFLAQPTAKCQHLELRPGEWLNNMAVYFQEEWDRQPISSVPPAASN